MRRIAKEMVLEMKWCEAWSCHLRPFHPLHCCNDAAHSILLQAYNVHCLVATDLDLHSGIPLLLLSGKKHSSIAPDAAGYTRRSHRFEWGKFLDDWNEERSRSPQEISRGKELEALKSQRVDAGVDRESYVQSLSNNSGFYYPRVQSTQGHLHTQPQLVFSSQSEEENNTLDPTRSSFNTKGNKHPGTPSKSL
ncbi:hypothetical protein Taro_036482 [Colocasia esculenta]|uniref:Uncharacterized protein n=1 Tax=Colocasia esculenta TaxID=4460 RepID=A0A843W6X9_COLES|nr:hypothetical protein [Colocasia esculenta]